MKFLDQAYLPRWIVLFIDLSISFVSLLILFYLLKRSPITFLMAWPIYTQVLVVLGVTLVSFILFRTYSGIVRHSTFADVLKLVFSSVFIGVILLLTNIVYQSYFSERIFRTPAILLYVFFSFTLLLLFRITVKEVYQLLRKNSVISVDKKRVLIFGIDEHSLSVGNTIMSNKILGFKLVGFVNDKFHARGGKISGRPLIPLKDNFKEIISKYKVDAIIISEQSYSFTKRNKIVNECLVNGIEIFNVPAFELLNSSDGLNIQIKPFQIEDLLERQPIAINNELIKIDIEGKTVLVTGGAGSIGSEIIIQIAVFKPKQIVIIDQAESDLHELELRLKEYDYDIDIIFELTSVTNIERTKSIFLKYKIDIIYHAAAYKHVPMLERNPKEAIFTNIQGTINIVLLAIELKVGKFVLISTDKAVNPTNVMGASKRAAEMYVQSIQKEGHVKTKFITTRFGNVMGSNGSVIPYFKKQIEKGGPITVTHKDVIRYFMTIPEACQLVLQAGTMGNGGEIFVFDMGTQVKILNLAEKMIRLSGFEPYTDIDIKFIGLRPGEKLYEELINKTSTSLPTHHKKIMISKVPVVSFTDVSAKIDEIIFAAYHHTDETTVALLKGLIPEFKSKNSVFEALDGVTSKPEKSI